MWFHSITSILLHITHIHCAFICFVTMCSMILTVKLLYHQLPMHLLFWCQQFSFSFLLFAVLSRSHLLTWEIFLLSMVKRLAVISGEPYQYYIVYKRSAFVYFETRLNSTGAEENYGDSWVIWTTIQNLISTLVSFIFSKFNLRNFFSLFSAETHISSSFFKKQLQQIWRNQTIGL